MSERGSFVTEYIGCIQCFEAAKKVLLGDNKYHCSQVIKASESNDYPIIAGKIGGMYAGEEINTFEFDLNKRLSEVICHPVRIAVLAEVGEKIFTVYPCESE